MIFNEEINSIISYRYLLRTIDDGLVIEIIEFWILLKSSLNDESVSSLLSTAVDTAVIVCTDLLSQKKNKQIRFFLYNNV